MNILAIGAHPDDVELRCGGTLLKYKALGHSIFVALTTSGNQGSNTHTSREEIAKIREEEQLEAAKIYDGQVRFLRFDDQFLLDTPETRRAVLNAMRWANPDVILTHYPGDSSTDHEVTGKLVSLLQLSLPGTLIPADEPPMCKFPTVFFWDTSAGIGFSPKYYVDIDDVFETKIKAILKHKSQHSWLKTFKNDDFIESIRIQNMFRGLQAGCQYAEGFIPLRGGASVPNVELLP